MDNITHAVIGAAIGEALAGRRIGKKAMLWGAVAANIPDIDVFFAPFQSVPDSLLSHRGFTHSILFLVLATLLFSWLMTKFNVAQFKVQSSPTLNRETLNLEQSFSSNDFKLWVVIFSTCLFSHILLDACTSYGTGWFEPFNHYRVSFNCIFVVDAFYTLPMLVSFIVLLIMKRDSKARERWNAWGAGISMAYLLFGCVNKVNINNAVEKNILSSKIEYQEYVTTPTPLNNLLWYVMIKDTAGFYIGYRSILDKSDKIDLHYYPQNKQLLDAYRGDEGVDKLVRFAEGYYCLTSRDSSNVDFHDLRFGQIEGWDNPTTDFIFSYHLGHIENNELVIQRGRMNVATKAALSSLIQRIKGI